MQILKKMISLFTKDKIVVNDVMDGDIKYKQTQKSLDDIHIDHSSNGVDKVSENSNILQKCDIRITHQSIYKISNDKVFDNVNSYRELNESIKLYGQSKGDVGSDEYNNSVGKAFEIFTQFFFLKHGDTPLIGIKNIQDTSEDPSTAGYDFTYIDLRGKPGQIQSKWRSNPNHQFTLNELATNSAIAADMGIDGDNNILFTNLEDTEELFHYTYKTAKNRRRVFGRNSQEEVILRDPKFWEDFRNCISESIKSDFEDPYTPRDIQEWILNGVNKDGIIYEGTEVVLNGKYNKGKVEASTGAGKTLCQFYNFDRSFKVYKKNLCVMIIPTRSLITQTFKEFYKWKMFGSDGVDSGVSALIIMSGAKPRYNDQIATVLQTLNVKESVEFIKSEIGKGRKVVVFTTMKSHGIKYSDIIDELKNENIRVGLEIIDEYHNVISTSSDRKDQLEIAEYLRNNVDRTDGSLFYSASNKDGKILSSFNEELFGKLLCKVNRNDLRVRAYVSPKLVFKLVRVKSKSLDSETRRDATRVGLDIDKAQSEAVAVIVAYKDLCKYYKDPNMITFGNHVEGCRYISENDEVYKNLPGVKHHFMAAETTNGDRDLIIENIKNSGGNILHQHSVAKEGINLPNLHGGIIGRGMSIISLQQSIGRSDRSLWEDTKKFNKGELSLDSDSGWTKYYNLVYLIIDSDDSFAERVKEIVGYLLNEGIPEGAWDISELMDDEKGGVEYDKPDFFPTIEVVIKFDSKKFNDMIQQVKIEIIEEENRILENLERERLNSLSKLELLKQKISL
jgi:superfamily II DNA or RNA helicase